MARGKNTAALFEVMGKGNGGARPKGPLGTPSWWNKNKTDAPTPNLEPGTAPAPIAPGDLPGPTNRLELDGDRQELRVRMSYTMVAVGLFAVVTAIGLAVIIGREMGSRTARPLTTTGLQRGPAEPSVLNVTPNNAGGNTPGGASPIEPPANGNGGGAGGPTPPAPNPNPPGPVAPPGKVARTVGLTYVIAQSYPTEEQARAVVDYLASRGIATTAERLPTWNKAGWTVLSADGFPRTAKADIDALKRKMDQASVEKAQAEKKWKALTPQGFRWQG